MKEVYGVMWPDEAEELTIELAAFARRECSPEERWVHFKRVVDLAFNCEGSTRRVVWNPWLKKAVMSILRGGRRHQVGWAGSASSGKSDGAALYSIVSYWARPAETTVIAMSTTKQGARKRIWKSVLSYWRQASRMGCPGKLNDSIGVIKGQSMSGETDQSSGFTLMAAGKSDVGDACENLIGIKNPVVIVIADEMPDLGFGIIEAMDNLEINERVLLLGLGNPNLRTDPFGMLCEPKKGWKLVSDSDDEWETLAGGTCVRFDGEKSPRILEGNDDYWWQPDQDWLDKRREASSGGNSRGYWRFVKAMWPPEGVTNGVYSEAEFISAGAMEEREPFWDQRPTQVASIDPGFTRGGDRSQACIVKVGKVDGRDHLHVSLEAQLQEDVTDTENPLSHQMVHQWRDLCTEEFYVRPSCAIADGTGSGISFGHIIDREWSPAVEKINFGSKPSGRKAAFREKNTGSEADEKEFFDKNSELWIQLKQYLRSGQISGLSMETMSELVARDYHDKSGRLLRVEDKRDAKKKNNGNSPDRADAFLMAVDKAISLGIFKSEEVMAVGRKLNKGFNELAKKRALKKPIGVRMRSTGSGLRRLR